MYVPLKGEELNETFETCRRSGVFEFAYGQVMKYVQRTQGPGGARSFEIAYSTTKLPKEGHVNMYRPREKSYTDTHVDNVLFATVLISLGESEYDGTHHPLEIRCHGQLYVKYPLPTGSAITFGPLLHRLPSAQRQDQRATLALFY